MWNFFRALFSLPAFWLPFVAVSKADFGIQPRISSGGALQTSTLNAFAAGPLITDLAPAEDFAIEGWVFIPKRGLTTGIPGFLFLQEGLAAVQISGGIVGGQIEIFFGVATGEPRQFRGPTFVRFWAELEDSWHQIACVNDEKTGELRIYLDGIITVPRLLQTTTFGSLPANTDQLLIGGGYDDRDLAWGYFWDEIRVSSRIRYDANFTVSKEAFTPDAATRALWHFDDIPSAQALHDASGNNHTLTTFNGAIITALSNPA